MKASTWLVLLLFLALPIAAEPLLLERTSAYALELEGALTEAVEIYHAEGKAAFVVRARELGGLLLVDVPAGAVSRLEAGALRRLEPGVFELGASRGEVVGNSETVGERVLWELDGMRAVLRPAPPVVGRRSVEAVKALYPAYARGPAAKSRTPAGALKSRGREVVVRIYFASWQRTNDGFVEEVLRASDALEDPGVRFELHGLSRPLSEDPEARRLGIYGAPTALVLVEGEEVGRVKGSQWRDPIQALVDVLEEVP